MRRVRADIAAATGIAVSAVGGAVAVAANNGYGGGVYYRPPSPVYGAAWDQFYGQNHALIWRCRDTGRFAESMVDSTWPGWST
ncbi:hypothetical protein MesoLj113b_73240 (plasmid) [Mesorhizobium sp. 113-3-3]|nr:hypothetical protein MesoLj113b_73240 [Mesorhizobium sp. 113-3-3]